MPQAETEEASQPTRQRDHSERDNLPPNSSQKHHTDKERDEESGTDVFEEIDASTFYLSEGAEY